MDAMLDLREKYRIVRKLLEEEYKKDPETEPYRSKYQAKRILLEMKEIIAHQIDSMEKEDSRMIFFQGILPLITYQIGLIFVDTEEPSEAEKVFKECYDSIVDHLDFRFILVSIHVRNQLGILWAQRCQEAEAKSWLEGAEKIYEDFKLSGRVPMHFHDHFEEEPNSDGEKELETVHTLTKFYLAQVYGAMKDYLKSAIYCHKTLQRQMIYDEYDSIEWALSSATLSQFFMEKILFKQARHHLAAASFVLDNYEKSLDGSNCSKEELENTKEKLRQKSSDVSRCWAKYGISLLEHSRNRLEEPEKENGTEKSESDLEKLWFENLNLTDYENLITDSEVVSFEDARQVFLFTQKHLNRAKEYYTLEDRAMDHFQIVQDHSRLFKNLTDFEPNEDRQCKMMKKRIEMLEAVVKELNPIYYLEACSHLWFELGEIYHDLMHVKFRKVTSDTKEALTPQALKKINSLMESSISNIDRFLDSVKDKTEKRGLETLPEYLIRPILIAHFYKGRLYYKYITQDKRKKMENTEKSYECFKYVVDCCKESEEGRTVCREELDFSRKMMKLLQMKLSVILN